MKIIGIVGTAKNTGKTTTLAALIEEAARRSVRLGVTGIGYDGEKIDTITGLPKPRLLLQPGTIVSTSEACLNNTTAGYAVIKQTSAETALGRVVIVQITRPGMMVLAGPNTKARLHDLIADMRALQLELMVVDGSLNRIAAMSVVETIIFTTGASRATEISFLSEEARAICRLFEAPEFTLKPTPRVVTLLDQAMTAVDSRLSMRSVYDEDDARAVASCVTEEVAAIVIPGMAALRSLECLVRNLSDKRRLRPLSIIVNDPTIMLLAGEPILTQRLIDAAHDGLLSFGYLHPIRVAAMTINPFYPLQHEQSFMPAYVDKAELLSSVTDAVLVPVFNITDGGAPASLYSLL